MSSELGDSPRLSVLIRSNDEVERELCKFIRRLSFSLPELPTIECRWSVERDVRPEAPRAHHLSDEASSNRLAKFVFNKPNKGVVEAAESWAD